MANLLLVEDDDSIAASLCTLLKQNGLSVQTAGTQALALQRLRDERYDLLLLDVKLPDGNGFSVCATAKQIAPDLPIIFLTASDDEPSVVAGLTMGADDYISKPFRPMELISRIRTALRRRNPLSQVIALGSLEIDVVRAAVFKNGKEIPLSALEYRLLLMFANHRGAVLSRDMLLDALWDVGGDFVNDNTLTVYIKRLREKIEDDPQVPAIIKTVRGLGYKAGE